MLDIFAGAIIAILIICLLYCVITIVETNRAIRHEEEEIDRMKNEFLEEFYKEEDSKNDKNSWPN